MGRSVDDFRPICEMLVECLKVPPEHPPEWPDERWEAFREASQTHGVTSLLSSTLEQRRLWLERLGQWLDFQYGQNKRRVSRLAQELKAILEVFERNSLPVMPLKGLALTDLVYEDFGLRPMNDIDILLRPDDCGAAETLLAELGYEKVFAGWKHTKFAKRGNRQVVDVGSEHPDNPRPIEVHPSCAEQIRDVRVDLTDRAWATARIGTLLQQKAWIMHPDVLWLYLLVHATHHMLLNSFRLIQLVDLARLRSSLNSPGMLLDSVDARATIAPLKLLHDHFPSRQTEDLFEAQSRRISEPFAAWVGTVDLFSVSYLNPTPWRV